MLCYVSMCTLTAERELWAGAERVNDVDDESVSGRLQRQRTSADQQSHDVKQQRQMRRHCNIHATRMQRTCNTYATQLQHTRNTYATQLQRTCNTYATQQQPILQTCCSSRQFSQCYMPCPATEAKIIYHPISATAWSYKCKILHITDTCWPNVSMTLHFSALEALRNALYKFKIYLLTYLLRHTKSSPPKSQRKKCREECKHCALAIVRWSQSFQPAADALPGVQDGQNLIS